MIMGMGGLLDMPFSVNSNEYLELVGLAAFFYFCHEILAILCAVFCNMQPVPPVQNSPANFVDGGMNEKQGSRVYNHI